MKSQSMGILQETIQHLRSFAIPLNFITVIEPNLSEIRPGL